MNIEYKHHKKITQLCTKKHTSKKEINWHSKLLICTSVFWAATLLFVPQYIHYDTFIHTVYTPVCLVLFHFSQLPVCAEKRCLGFAFLCIYLYFWLHPDLLLGSSDWNAELEHTDYFSFPPVIECHSLKCFASCLLEAFIPDAVVNGLDHPFTSDVFCFLLETEQSCRWHRKPNSLLIAI